MNLVVRKYHGNGNDFLLLEADALPETDWSRFARAVCDRHFGVGADGCIFIASGSSGCSIRIFNCDGSEAGMSGNGSRCVATFLSHRKKQPSPMVFDTRSGPRTFQLVRSGGREPGRFGHSWDSLRSNLETSPVVHKEVKSETIR